MRFGRYKCADSYFLSNKSFCIILTSFDTIDKIPLEALCSLVPVQFHQVTPA